MPITSLQIADTDSSIPMDFTSGPLLTGEQITDISNRLLSDVRQGYSVGTRRQRWSTERHLLYLYGRVQGWPYAKIAAICGVKPKAVRWFFDHITPSSIFKYPIVHKSRVAGVARYNCRLCGVEEGENEESVRMLIAAEHFFAFDVVEIRGVWEPG